LLAKTDLCAYKSTKVKVDRLSAVCRNIGCTTAKYQQFGHGGKPVMNSEYAPKIGDWYKNTIGDAFEVVAQDDDDDTLELQYYDGTLEELDAETWESMRPEPIEPPEDWIGSMDISPEDTHAPEIWSETEDWMSALERMDRNPR
jgi:hypothetical protein